MKKVFYKHSLQVSMTDLDALTVTKIFQAYFVSYFAIVICYYNQKALLYTRSLDQTFLSTFL